MKPRHEPVGGGHPAPAPAISNFSIQGGVHFLLERLVTVYQANLEKTHQAREYLKDRGLGARDLWSRYRVGYSDGSLTQLLPVDGPILDQLAMLGVLTERRDEILASHLIFPVYDAEGGVVTLVGHSTASSEAEEVMLAGAPRKLWNAGACKASSRLLLVTSVLDGLSLHAAGFNNVIAAVGGKLIPEDLNLFKNHGVRQISLVLGEEEAATLGATLTAALRNFDCATRVLPAGYTLNRYLQTCGADTVVKFINDTRAEQNNRPADKASTQVLADGFSLALGLRKYEIRGLEKGPRSLKATVRVEHAGKLHVDTLDFYSAKARRQLVQDLTRLFETSAETINAEVIKIMENCEQHDPSLAKVPTSTLAQISPEKRAAAEAFGQNPLLLERIAKDYERCGLVGEKVNGLLCYLALTSRKIEKPLSVLILSSSGAGKTTLQDTATLFCPPEDLVKLTSLSGKALFYKEQSSLKQKVLALEEGEGMIKATYALRNLISAGELVIETTTKDVVTGKLVTVENRVEGPTAVFITTTNPATDAETKSRFFVTGIDESRQQTRAILAAQRQHQTLAGQSARRESEDILTVHRDFQRLLRPLAVINPYAEQLTYGDDRLQSRRDQLKYLNLIRAVAFLRQMQKTIKTLEKEASSQEYIEVDLEDIRLANELTVELVGHTLGELSRPGYELLMLLEKMRITEPKPEHFTRREIREFSGWNHDRVYRYLRELVQFEYVLVENGRNGLPHRYRLMYEGQGKGGQKFLLGLRAIEELRLPQPIP